MQKLMCEICSGSLIMNTDGIAVCEYCGMKYTKEKVAQMIKIDGPVEITKGEAEKERLLKNAETYLSLGKHKEAYELCQRITNEYTDDYRGWYLAFKSGVYALAKNSFQLSKTENNLTVVDSHLATAIKLSKNKYEFGREALRFWYDVLCEKDTDFVSLYHLHIINKCTENHILSIFLKKIDEQISLLVNQLNLCHNKKSVCEKLNFSLGIDELAEIKKINSFSSGGGSISADGIVVNKIFDGLTFFGGKSKYRYEDEERKNIYWRRIQSYNELQDLIKTVNNLTNKETQ